jgi:hypothetical protein
MAHGASVGLQVVKTTAIYPPPPPKAVHLLALDRCLLQILPEYSHHPGGSPKPVGRACPLQLAEAWGGGVLTFTSQRAPSLSSSLSRVLSRE